MFSWMYIWLGGWKLGADLEFTPFTYWWSLHLMLWYDKMIIIGWVHILVGGLSHGGSWSIWRRWFDEEAFRRARPLKVSSNPDLVLGFVPDLEGWWVCGWSDRDALVVEARSRRCFSLFDGGAVGDLLNLSILAVVMASRRDRCSGC